MYSKLTKPSLSRDIYIHAIAVHITLSLPNCVLLHCLFVCVCVCLQVHDIAFTKLGGGRDLFASVGSDGSVRLFDLRYYHDRVNYWCEHTVT